MNESDAARRRLPKRVRAFTAARTTAVQAPPMRLDRRPRSLLDVASEVAPLTQGAIGDRRRRSKTRTQWRPHPHDGPIVLPEEHPVGKVNAPPCAGVEPDRPLGGTAVAEHR